ncbi:hypothetical protein GCM10007874_60340 [Labrys miyagiensis]|uniref:Uncharacterized protein n=1 Tax=Labrys miyagiensis TaxID=346912 RepID=A0ABQ6CTG0_9HYPH|nr:hypothetical protein [Labrys miyagiensis]GLS23014.1 hypothetical protein GCM10007874_60340 [Labrys miyagiensis]
MNEPTLAERLAAAAARANSATASQPQQVKAEEKKTVHQQVVEEVDISEKTAESLDIKNNPFYKALSDTQTTQDEKIAEISRALDASQQTSEQLQQNFQLFQQYYTYIQSEEMDESLENVRRLIAQLQDNSKVEIANILRDLKGMLDDVALSRQLIEVLRQSRVTGETVKQMSEAMDRNEALIKDLDYLTKKKAEAAGALTDLKALLDQRIAEKNVEQAKLSNKIFGLFKADTSFNDKVLAAESLYNKQVRDAAEIDDRIASCNAQRRKDLEEGPLRILRSIDEVDDNLTDRLISSGNKGIATIQGAQKAVLQLMGRTQFSEAEVDKIARRVSDKQISLTVLKSGLQQASANTNDFKETTEVKSAQAEMELSLIKAPSDGSTPSIIEIANKETAAISLRTTVGEVIDYQKKLNDTITEMGITLSRNDERQTETDSQRKIVQGTKKSIAILGRDTLNTVAGNLEGVLHNLVADQTDETQAAITEFSKAAEDIRKGTLQSMIARQGEMHDKDMSLLDSTISRLNESADIIAKALEVSVDEGIERAAKQEQLKAATANLENATTTMRKVVGDMSNLSVQGKG